ncbi:unnamed protein product [Owenia fusiformis]|uniref:Uncharacterized protein n=1 Tax=Owenia fusiformis TaxID=6347 RepID=A0A8J1XZL5_OWEFU|nr:unnamed protein product [Owenia fusiformis]
MTSRSRSAASRAAKMVESLTDQEKRELSLAFQLLDQNGDGLVSSTELKHMLSSLGFDTTWSQVQNFVKQAGSQELGVDEDEFILWMCRNCNVQSANVTESSFSAFDRDNDGYISKAELSKCLQLLGVSVSDEMLDLMLRQADLDRDGKISFEEFVNVLDS